MIGAWTDIGHALELGCEIWFLRSSCKRVAREILLTHYSELSPDMDALLVWCCENHRMLPPGAVMRREDLLVVYRKAKIADLTGVFGQNRKAKFIYDQYQVSV